MSNRSKIFNIGRKLASCSLRCPGIIDDPPRGILPRCLYYESGKNYGQAAIIIGINPGESSEREREFYINSKKDYSAEIDYWNKKIKDLAYYRKIRALIRELGFVGDIVWTDLAKCECRGKRGEVPIQTLRICVDRFLEQEIKSMPRNFTIIAIGNIAFNFCALRFPDYFVVGLPHPTGAWGTFKRLKDNIHRNKKNILMILKQKRINIIILER